MNEVTHDASDSLKSFMQRIALSGRSIVDPPPPSAREKIEERLNEIAARAPLLEHEP